MSPYKKRKLLSLLAGLMVLNVASNATAAPDPKTELIERLSNAHAAPGSEENIRNIIVPIWQKNLTNLKVDKIGNVLGLLPNGSSTPKILVMSHMDEVGFLVRNITDDGFVQVEPLGGWRNQVVYAQRWKIATKTGFVTGYSGNESGHIVPRQGQSSHTMSEEQNTAREMVLDVGAKTRKEAEKKFGLRPGLAITPDTAFTKLNGTNRYLGKAFDDRAGVALATNLIEFFTKTTHPNNVAIAATVQEEVGLRGANVIANEYEPDVVLNIEACIAGDHPLMSTPKETVFPALGKGPCLYVYERTMVPNNKLIDWVSDVAKDHNIPFQYATAINYGQDGSVLQQSNLGAAVINIGIPVRYAHQEAGVMDRADYDNTLRLVELIVKSLDEKEVKLILPH